MSVELIFPSAVEKLKHPELLSIVEPVLSEYIAREKPNMWNVCQSTSIIDDRIKDLLYLISKVSFEMLVGQGYNMTHSQTSITEIWGQQFLKTGQHVEHVHSNNAQITGFYFVKVPKNSSLPIVFDPRPGKNQINLPQNDMQIVTYASKEIVFEVQSGDLLFFNSWLPHGFTRHQSDEPFQFIHFNVAVEDVLPIVEII